MLIRSIALFVLVWPALNVVAQDAPPAESATTSAAAAPVVPSGDLLHRALAAYDGGDWEQARQLFESLHSLTPTARTARALGTVAFMQGRDIDAVFLLEESLASQEKPLTPQLAESARAVLAQARGRLGSVELVGGVGPEEVSVDGGPARVSASGHVLLTPGVHQLSVAEGQGRAARQVTFDALAGTMQTLDLAAREIDDAPAAPEAASTHAPSAQAVVSVPSSPPSMRAPSTRRRRAALGLIGGAIGSVVLATVASALRSSRVGGIEDDCRTAGGCTQERVDDLSRDGKLAALGAVAITGWSAALVSGVTGATLLVMARGTTDAPAVSGVELRLLARF